MNKIKRIVLGFLLTSLAAIIFMIVMPSNKVYGGSYDAATNTVIISVTPLHTENGYATPQANEKYINIVISGTKEMNGVATISYTTLDRSAVASAGDYQDKTDVVTISKNNPTVTVSINVNVSSKFATQTENDFYTRFFLFQIVNVDYKTDAEHSTEKAIVSNDSVKCALRSEHILKAKQNTGKNKFLYYEVYDTVRKDSQWMSVDDNEVSYTNYSFNSEENNVWLNDYINTGLADAYVGMEMRELYDKGYSAADLWFNLENKSGTLLQRYKMDYSTFSKYNFYYGSVIYDTDSVKNCQKYDPESGSYWNRSAKDGDLYVADFATPQLYLCSNGTKYRLLKATDSLKNTNSVNNLVMRVKMDNDDGGYSIYRRKGYVDVHEVLQDYRAPEARSCYIDPSKIYVDGKVRVAVRYTEPVQLYDTNFATYLEVIINQKGYTFAYEGGAGTDTLYFCIDAASLPNMDIGQIKVRGIVNDSKESINNVCDLSRHFNKDNMPLYSEPGTDNYANFAIVNYGGDYSTLEKDRVSELLMKGVNLQLAAKEATVSGGDKIATATRTMNVTVETLRGGFYYSWIREEDLEAFHQAVAEAKTKTGAQRFECYDEYYRIFDLTSTTSSSSFSIEALDKNGNKLNGNYVFCYALDGGNGKVTYSDDSYLYTFDSTAANVEINSASGDNLSRSFEFTIHDIYNFNSKEYKGTGISSIQLNYSFVKGQTTGEKFGSVLIWNGTNTIAQVNSDEVLVVGAKGYNPETGSLSFTIAPKELGLDSENGDYGYYDFELVVTDNCGNETIVSFGEDNTVASNPFRFDTRTLFEVTRTAKTVSSDYELESQKVLSGVTTDFEAYYLNNGDVKNVIQIDFKSKESGSFKIKSLKYRGIQYIKNAAPPTDASYTNYFSYNKVAVEGTDSIIITPKASGTLEIIFSLDGTKTSDTFVYYFTEDATDDTVNYQSIFNAHYVKSKVYQLGFTDYYYIGESYQSGVQKKNYNDSQKSLYFSSQEEAGKYLRFYEYQDLYLYKVADENEAANINSGGLAQYKKADSETKEAQVGQWWIRYKKTNFLPNSVNINQWGNYFYANASEIVTSISLSKLSSNLQNSINTVVSTLLNNGCDYTYLSSSENHTSDGMVYIEDSRMITSELTASHTFSGCQLSSTISYQADINIYSDIKLNYEYSDDDVAVIKSKEENVHLLMHNILSQGSNTRIFLVKNENKIRTYTEIHNFDGKELDSYISDDYSGEYEFVELDTNGIRCFKLVVDHDAPNLKISYKTADTQTEVILNQGDDGKVFGVKEITFLGIEASEVDYYSYVALYKVTRLTSKLVQTLTLEELKTKEFELEDASYIVKVSDRYGNSYSFRVNLMQEELKCKIKIADDNDYLSVIVENRGEDEIYSYKIITPSKVVTEFASKQQFKESGTYSVEIEDIYGYIFSETNIEYKRNNPELTWKYYIKSTDTYETYKLDKDTKEPLDGQPMKIINQSDNLCYIVTSTALQFTYTGDYDFEWICDKGQEPEYTSDTKAKRWTISTTKDWSLKVSYSDYSDVYVIYTCEIDSTSPVVNASYELSEYTIADEDYLKSLVEKFDFTDEYVVLNGVVCKKRKDKDGSYIKDEKGEFVGDPVTFAGNSAYYVEKSGTKDLIYLKSGDQCQSQSVSISITDNNGVKSCAIYKDAQAIDSSLITFNSKDKSYTALLTEYGSYTIVAEDYFGNKTNFSFVSKQDNITERKVDSKVVTDKATYGNTSDEIVIASSGVIRYYITDEESSEQYMFVISKDGVTQVTYTILYSETDKKYFWGTTQVGIVYELKNSDYVENTWYEVQGISDEIMVMYDSNGYHFKVNSNEIRKDIQVAYQSENVIPYQYETILSKEKTNVILETSEGERLETNEEGDTILIHDSFLISTKTNLKDITKIRVSFSKTSSFINYSTIYYGAELSGFDTTRDGFYLIEITNIFGNVLTYTLAKSNSMTVVVSTEYADGTKMYYDNDHTSTTYSNNSVTITLYATNGNFSVNREFNGKTEKYTGYELVEGKDSCSITISSEGSYVVTAYDEYGNSKRRLFQIKKDGELSIDDGVIYGYNEKALRMDEGYTNQKLSIDINSLKNLDIYRVTSEFDGETEVLYDRNASSSENLLLQSIGTKGSGVYTITFRDKYGNADIRIIHYQEESTLFVAYKYRSSTKYLYANSGDDVWCNNAVLLTSTANSYEFRIDGARTAIPTTPFTFSSSDGNGEFVYHIQYVDEYGFSHEFDIHLLRQTITIELDSDVPYTEIDGIITTREDFSVVATNDTKVTYTLDGIYGPYVYENESLIEEGLYEITAIDRAGNQSVVKIKKDRSVDTPFTEVSTGRVIFSGYVASSKVSFTTSNSDHAFIYKAYRNGEECEILDTYIETGKYEFLIRDEVGNEGYFMFYIITHALASLEYKVPFNYEINEIWRVDASGYQHTCIGDDDVKVDEYFKVSVDGMYTVTMINNYTTDTITFKFTIDSTPSKAKLNGCNEGETTVNTITITNCAVGDTVYIYKDGKLYKTIEIESSSEVPSISEGGYYKIVVVNEAGVETTMSFTRVAILNTAGSTLVIILLSSVALALFAGLAFRKRSKIDK